MVAFLIADKNSDDLNTPVFRAGPNGREEAVIAFTGSKAAKKYIEQLGWERDHTVAEVAGADFVAWLVQALEKGIRFLAVDPEPDGGQEAGRERMVNIGGQLSAAGDRILRMGGPES